MRTRNALTIVLTIVMMIASPMLAETNYTGAGADDLWSNPDNWDNGYPTFNNNGASIANINGDFTIEGVGAHKNPPYVTIGYGQSGTLNLLNGTLNVSKGLVWGNEHNGAIGLNIGGAGESAILNVTATDTSGSSFHSGVALFELGIRSNKAAIANLQKGGELTFRVPTANTNSWTHLFIGVLANNTSANGTFNLDGGVLDAGSRSIVLGDDVTYSITSEFNFTGGRLENLDSFMRAGKFPNSNNFTLTDYLAPTPGILTQSGGVFAPGTVTEAGGVYTVDPAGTSTIHGHLTQSGTANYEVNITAATGTPDVEWDLIDVTGDYEVTGTPTLTALPNFVPTGAESFTILQWAGADPTAATPWAVSGSPEYVWDAGSGADTAWDTAENWNDHVNGTVNYYEADGVTPGIGGGDGGVLKVENLTASITSPLTGVIVVISSDDAVNAGANAFAVDGPAASLTLEALTVGGQADSPTLNINTGDLTTTAGTTIGSNGTLLVPAGTTLSVGGVLDIQTGGVLDVSGTGTLVSASLTSAGDTTLQSGAIATLGAVSVTGGTFTANDAITATSLTATGGTLALGGQNLTVADLTLGVDLNMGAGALVASNSVTLDTGGVLSTDGVQDLTTNTLNVMGGTLDLGGKNLSVATQMNIAATLDMSLANLGALDLTGASVELKTGGTLKVDNAITANEFTVSGGTLDMNGYDLTVADMTVRSSATTGTGTFVATNSVSIDNSVLTVANDVSTGMLTLTNGGAIAGAGSITAEAYVLMNVEYAGALTDGTPGTPATLEVGVSTTSDHHLVKLTGVDKADSHSKCNGAVMEHFCRGFVVEAFSRTII